MFDMGDTPIDDTNPDVPSKRKYGNIKCDGHKNCGVDSLKEKSKKFDNHMFYEFGFDVDTDYKQYLTENMMSTPGDYDCDDKGVNDDAGDDNPQYQLFLDSFKLDGDSYVVQINEENGLSEPWKYNVKDCSDDELDLDSQRKMKNIRGENVGDDKSNSSSGSQMEAPMALSGLPENQRRESVLENDTSSEPVNSNPFGAHGCSIEELGNGGIYESDGKCKTNARGKKHKSRILRKSRAGTKGEKLETAVNAKKRKDDKCDEDYRIFCSHIRSDGNNLVLDYKKAPPVVYESDEKLEIFQPSNKTHSMTEKTQLPAHAGGSDATVRGDDNCHYLGSPGREGHSPFREQLMSTLRKPYNPKEHQKLFQTIEARKPIERNLDLRYGREKSYTTKKKGKSYLDHYYEIMEKLIIGLRWVPAMILVTLHYLSFSVGPMFLNGLQSLALALALALCITSDDLKIKLLACKTTHEELNLLRGFFFWIQNLTQEGAFKPWLDASCRACLPQTS